MTERKAILIGLLFVNLPVLFLLVGPLFFLGNFTSKLGLLGILAIALGFAFAWLWWSLFIPKWRLWAYSQVKDIGSLKVAAVKVGLTWPDGSIFERTELKSAAHAAKEKRYEQNT